MFHLSPQYNGEQLRLIFQNRPQSWRQLLRILSSIHFVLSGSSLVFNWFFLGPEYRRFGSLSVFVLVVSVTSRMIWRRLFHTTHSFLGYRRPSRSYIRAIYVTSLLLTVPTWAAHLVLLDFHAHLEKLSNIPLLRAILQLVVLFACHALYLWMVRRFLLRNNDDRFEPTVTMLRATTNNIRTRFEEGARASSTLGSTSAWTPRSYQSHAGLLSSIHAQQQARFRTTEERAESFEGPGPRILGTDTGGGHDSNDCFRSDGIDEDDEHPPPCKTIARFDYMPQNRAGPHSWPSSRLVLYLLGIYSAVVAVLNIGLMIENSHALIPSPKAKCGLYAPIGGYLLCAFAITRRLRHSLFTNAHVPPPPPWIRVSLVGRLLFENVQDGTTTKADPSIRGVSPDSPDYVTKYNQTNINVTCGHHFGHQGRSWVAEPRIWPTLATLAYLGLSFWLFVKGFWCIFKYPLRGDLGKHPNVTIPDLERQIRIMSWNIYLLTIEAPLLLVVLAYSAFSGFSTLHFLAKSILENAPAERQRFDQGVQL